MNASFNTELFDSIIADGVADESVAPTLESLRAELASLRNEVTALKVQIEEMNGNYLTGQAVPVPGAAWPDPMQGIYSVR